MKSPQCQLRLRRQATTSIPRVNSEPCAPQHQRMAQSSPDAILAHLPTPVRVTAWSNHISSLGSFWSTLSGILRPTETIVP